MTNSWHLTINEVRLRRLILINTENLTNPLILQDFMMIICKLYTVSGRVQGVWFRAGTQKAANQLGITGWAKNLPNRKVQVLACGESAQIEKFIAWLHKGPLLAKITKITEEDIPVQNFSTFEIV